MTTAESNPLKVALVRCPPPNWPLPLHYKRWDGITIDLNASIDAGISLINKAKENGAGLVAFPELWFPGFPKGRDRNDWDKTHLASYIDNSLVVGSPEWEKLLAAIKKAGIWTALAFSERLNNKIYMAQSLVSPTGEVVIHRHKLRPSGSERDMFSDGTIQEFKVLNLPIGRTGMLECGDMTFPMQAQREQLHVGCWPYALDPGDDSDVHWFNTHIVRHGISLYALLSGAYVLIPAVGHAFILDPLCNIVAELRNEVDYEEEPILYHTVPAFEKGNGVKEHDPDAQASWAVLQQLNESFPKTIPHEQGELVPQRSITVDDLKAGNFTWSE
ncbi:aliphatic nitrilase [Plectosphaerella plurivora]|uniref:nitrilase n=1 Tax=Plectosphaerella plurivora TaxID=936078 RepID=A0A9P8V2I4_9PEZI|nr:aliphatic nitrilase [Plectosphaerella plurivora]